MLCLMVDYLDTGEGIFGVGSYIEYCLSSLESRLGDCSCGGRLSRD